MACVIDFELTASHVSLHVVREFGPKPGDLWLVEAQRPVFGSLKLMAIKFQKSFVRQILNKEDEGRRKKNISESIDLIFYQDSLSLLFNPILHGLFLIVLSRLRWGGKGWGGAESGRRSYLKMYLRYPQKIRHSDGPSQNNLICILNLTNRPFAVGGHVTSAILNQSAMTKWHPEMERAGWLQ